MNLIKNEMIGAYKAFTEEQGHEPKFACVGIVFDGEDEQVIDFIKINDFDRHDTENDPDDDNVVFYADGLDELCRLTEEPLGDFIITEFNYFDDVAF